MSKQYRVSVNVEDPEVTIRLPLDIVKGLAERSEENGRDVQLEIAIRLARSLERDMAMQADDLKLLTACLEKLGQKNTHD